MTQSTLSLIAGLLIASTAALADSRPASEPLDAASDRAGDFATLEGRTWHETQRRISDELEAEHLLATLHEADAPDGKPISGAALQNIADRLRDPETRELLETSHYYIAVIEGRDPSAE